MSECPFQSRDKGLADECRDIQDMLTGRVLQPSLQLAMKANGYPFAYPYLSARPSRITVSTIASLQRTCQRDCCARKLPGLCVDGRARRPAKACYSRISWSTSQRPIIISGRDEHRGRACDG